jgi:hypothetical protein
MGETSGVRPSISLCSRYLWVPRGLPVVQVGPGSSDEDISVAVVKK